LSELYSLLIEEAKKAGFPIAGAVDIDLALKDPQQTFEAHLNRFDSWIEAGFLGQMEYLRRGRDRRADPRLVFPTTESIFCVGLPYQAQPTGAASSQEGPRYARYTQGRDYHLDKTDRLQKVMEAVKTQWQNPIPEKPLAWKVCVDTSAVLERTWAALAGLGWIGKNTLLIHPQYGSYFFLGEVLLNQATHQAPKLLPNYCGHCTRCLDGCPTQAFTQAGHLDSRRCISYWTLEKRGHLDISPEQHSQIGNWIAGCDICQEVCPFNRKATRSSRPADPSQKTPPTGLKSYWIDLLQETPEDYKKRTQDSALDRIKPAQFSRNLAITLTNAMVSWSQELPLTQVQTLLLELMPLIVQRLKNESDEAAKREWTYCQHIGESTQRIES
jgi:epoxyqueuosine reductase